MALMAEKIERRRNGRLRNFMGGSHASLARLGQVCECFRRVGEGQTKGGASLLNDARQVRTMGGLHGPQACHGFGEEAVTRHDSI